MEFKVTLKKSREGAKSGQGASDENQPRIESDPARAQREPVLKSQYTCFIFRREGMNPPSLTSAKVPYGQS